MKSYWQLAGVTLRPLGIKFRPFTNSVHDTSTINGVVQEYIDHTVSTLGQLRIICDQLTETCSDNFCNDHLNIIDLVLQVTHTGLML